MTMSGATPESDLERKEIVGAETTLGTFQRRGRRLIDTPDVPATSKSRRTQMKEMFVVAACLLLVSCGAGDQAGGKGNSEPDRQALDSEAELQAKRFWDKTMMQCGNRSFIGNADKEEPTGSRYLVEYKGLSFKLTNYPLTDADKLNGYEWKGRMTRKAKAWHTWPDMMRQWASWGADESNSEICLRR
jgi:hypothetical protein